MLFFHYEMEKKKTTSGLFVLDPHQRIEGGVQQF